MSCLTPCAAFWRVRNREKPVFFTRIGTVMAYIGFFFGLLQFDLDLLIIFSSDSMATDQAIAREYFAARDAGALVDRGFYVTLVSVALGVICEISARSRGTQP